MAKGKGDPCGDDICDAKIGENCDTCAKDCACDKGYSCSKGSCVANCGDGTCDAKIGENCDTCAKDCGCGAGYGCSKGSCVANAVCGNSEVENGEECDDGNTVTETCGDGTVQSGSYCNADCSGVISLSESCDDSDLDGESCVTPAQGFDGGTLTCDGGCGFDTSGCYSCGDGTVNGDEECDDGNSINTDACLNDCTDASCGDGNIWEGVEKCDDGNSDNTDDCLNDCANATCGDGYVWGDVEVCDDGNSDNTDDCLNDCIGASCGDGFIYAGIENCVNCPGDAGKCFDYDGPPTVHITGGGDIPFGGNNLNIWVEDATSCSFMIKKLTTEISRRGKNRQSKTEIIPNQIVDCDSINKSVGSIVSSLPNGDYTVTVTGTNNQGTDTESVDFTIISSPITITSPKLGMVYTEIIKPLAIVGVKGSSCSYAVNDCSQDFNCADGLNNEDILVVLHKTCFRDGKNEFSVTATINGVPETAKGYFLYMGTPKGYERLIKKSKSKRVSLKKDEGITLYPTVSGKIGTNVNISGKVARALLSMENAEGIVSIDDFESIIGSLSNSLEVEKTLGGIKTTGWRNVKLGVAPEVQIDNGSVEFNAFVSQMNEENHTYNLSAETHKLMVEISTPTNARSINGTLYNKSMAKITFHSDPITIELEDGECMAVDLNNDTFEDVIACYNSEDGVTVNNIVIIGDEMEPAIDEYSTIVAPITYTTENTYITTVDTKKMEEEFLRKLARGEYSVPLEGLDIKGIEKMLIKKYSPFLIVITLFLVYVVSVISFSGRVKPVKKNKKTKKVSKVLPKKIRKTKQKKTKK